MALGAQLLDIVIFGRACALRVADSDIVKAEQHGAKRNVRKRPQRARQRAERVPAAGTTTETEQLRADDG